MKKALSLILALALILSMSVTAFATGTDKSTHIVTNRTPEGVTNADAADGTPGWAEGTYTNGTADKDNDAKIAAIGNYDSNGDGDPDNEDGTQADVIAVDLTWDPMEWTYSKGGYDPNTMTSTDKWLDANKEINISNRSNVGITATPAYADDATVTGTTNLKFVTTVTDGNGSVTGNVMTLDKATAGDADTGTNGTATTGKITVSLDMDMMKSVTISADDTSLGTITVTVAKATT